MSSNIPPMIITDTGLTVFMDGRVLTAANDHPNFQAAKDAITAGEFGRLPDLLDIRSSVNRYVQSANAPDFNMIGDFLALDGKPFTMQVTEKVLDMIAAGAPVDPIYNFLRKVRKNPRVAAQDELLLFCAANQFMIHEDGDILAYKSVRGDYTDVHSGTIFNGVGQVIEMDRTAVDDDRNNTCSRGLHFASYQYASTWAGEIDGKNLRLVVMKINPADVVAIPNDYNNQKGRCWRYKVYAEVTDLGGPLPKREVYTDRDLGVESEIGVLEGELSDLFFGQFQIEREIEDLTQKYRSASNSAQKIEDLGGDASRMRADLSSIRDQRDEFIDELERINDRIAVVREEIIYRGGTPARREDFNFDDR